MATSLAPLSVGLGGWLGGGFTAFTNASAFDAPALTLNSALDPLGYTGGPGAWGATIANLGAGFTLGGSTFGFSGADTLALRLGGPLTDVGGGTGLGLTQAHAGTFAMNVADVSEAYIDGNAAQAKGGLAISVDLRSVGGEVAGIAGSVFSDSVTVTGGGLGATSLVSLGLGHDSFTGGSDTMDLVIGGHGDDHLKGGAGDDQLFGDADASGYAGDVAWIGNRAELGGVDPGTYLNAVAQLSYLGSESGFNNLVGYYYRNADGDLVGKVMFEDDRSAGRGIEVRLTAAEAETLQFFVIANGANVNRNALTGQGLGGDGLLGVNNTGVDIVVTTLSTAVGTIGQVSLASNGALLRSQLSNGLDTLLGSSNATKFSAYFSDNALNPYARDYSLDFGLNETGRDNATADFAVAALDSNGAAAGDPNSADYTFNASSVYTQAQINNGTIAAASGVNAAVLQQNNLWGQIGMEDLFQGTGATNAAGTAYTNNRTDRDFDDVVFQSRVWFELGEAAGADTLEGGADQGSFSLEWSLSITYQPGSSSANYNSGFGYYFSTSPTGEYVAGDVLQGALIDGALKTGAGTEYATAPGITDGADNTYTLTGLDVGELENLRWFLMRDLNDVDGTLFPAPSPVLIRAEIFNQEGANSAAVAANPDLLASRVYLDNGIIGTYEAGIDTLLAWNAQRDGSSRDGVGIFSEADLNYFEQMLIGQAVQDVNGNWTIIDADAGTAGIQPGAVPSLLNFTGTLGVVIEDGNERFQLDTGGDHDYNDVAFTITRGGPTITVVGGDQITTGGGADTVIWNSGDGLDIVTDFDITQDTLQWGPAGTPFAVLVDADGFGGADDLLIAEDVTSTEGVILLGVGTSTLGAWFA